jgi:hypothetical protein
MSSPPLPPPQLLGVGVGVVSAIVTSTLKAPSVVSATGGLRGAFAETLPYTVGAAAVYTIVSGVTKDATGEDDWRGEFAGGAAAGALVTGIKRRSGNAGFVGALAFGSVAAGTRFYQALNGNTNDSSKMLDERRTSVVTADFGRAAGASSSLHSRLQRQ